MSAKNRKSEVRERLAQQRREEEARAKRRRLFTQLGIVLGALVVVALIVVIVVVSSNRTPDASGDATPPSGTATTIEINGTDVDFEVTEAGVRLGDASAPVVIDLFEDFSCPHCQTYEAQVGSTFLQLAMSGDAVVNFNPIQIVTAYGTRAGSTSMCVAAGEPELWPTVHEQLFVNHSQSTDNWRTGNFRDFAEQLGVSDSDTLDCIFEGRYMGWIGTNTAAAYEVGVQGTPSLFINGEQSELLGPEQLIQAVEQLAG